jgi:hypothetical protein
VPRLDERGFESSRLTLPAAVSIRLELARTPRTLPRQCKELTPCQEMRWRGSEGLLTTRPFVSGGWIIGRSRTAPVSGREAIMCRPARTFKLDCTHLPGDAFRAKPAPFYLDSSTRSPTLTPTTIPPISPVSSRPIPLLLLTRWALHPRVKRQRNVCCLLETDLLTSLYRSPSMSTRMQGMMETVGIF